MAAAAEPLSFHLAAVKGKVESDLFFFWICLSLLQAAVAADW
jgi:hypothetical protein